jgi:TRAP-type uncharacterized transport system fused permease subunit
MARGPIFVVPISILLILLLMRYSAMYAGFYAVIGILIVSLIRRENWPTPNRLLRGSIDGAKAGAGIGLACACVGLASQPIITTGLGGKFATLVDLMSGGMLLPALIFTMLISILLGCGVPTLAAYGLVAIMTAPLLIKLGVATLTAHIFVFYFAIISSVTPPVATAALVGSAIARASYFKTALEGFKLAIAGFIIPYCIVYNPALTLSGGTTLDFVAILIGLPLAMLALASLLYRHFLAELALVDMILASIAVIAFIFAVIMSSPIGFIIGVLTFAGFFLSQRNRSTRKA